MKAIIKVKKSSQYSKLNGQEFDVKEEFIVKGKKIYALLGINPEYPKNTMDFTQDEVLILN